MWFVILRTLLPEASRRSCQTVQVPGSAQPEMLLVADDANAAYSNPRPLPKCAQTLLPGSAYTLPHRAASAALRGASRPVTAMFHARSPRVTAALRAQSPAVALSRPKKYI